jgi:hypothetical protein
MYLFSVTADKDVFSLYGGKQEWKDVSQKEFGLSLHQYKNACESYCKQVPECQ